MLSENLRQLRTKKKFTQSELAKDADVSKIYIAKIEQGVIKNPSVYDLKKVSDFLGVSLNELVK
jgi:HTH-type biofilm formation transcriptional regulator